MSLAKPLNDLGFVKHRVDVANYADLKSRQGGCGSLKVGRASENGRGE